MSLNKKSVDDLNAKGKRVLVRCDFNVPLKDGVITDETRIVAALPTINKLLNDGAKVILCSHLGKVKEGPNEKESLAPVAKRLSEKLGKEVVFVADYNVTGADATAAVEAMKDGDVVLLQNTRFRGKEETKPEAAGEAFAKELADLADDYVCDAFGSAHRAHKIYHRKGWYQRSWLLNAEGNRFPWQCSRESCSSVCCNPWWC